MCGISGIIDFNTPPRKATVSKMLKAISHRGPNSTGLYTNTHIVMGVNRLSVIDLKTGDQPISNETGSVTVVYNGEIYNFKELRAALIHQGHRFKTQSDTEVLVHLYEEFGPSFVRKLSGMFAFALWDTANKQLVLGRDQVGIKPLFFQLSNTTCSFSSELKSLLKNPQIPKIIDRIALEAYLSLGFIPGDLSIIQGVKKLSPGTILVMTKQGHKFLKYWKPKSFPKIAPSREVLNSLLAKSIDSQTISDVPWGVFLSGGLDSSLIVHYLSKHHRNIQTFSLKFTEPEFDESNFARQIAKKYKTHHTEILYTSKILRREFSEIVSKLDEPLADPSLFPTYHLAKIASKNVTVALSGDGGDELFGGYPVFQGDSFATIFQKIPKVFDSFLQNLSFIFPVTFGTYSKNQTLNIFFTALRLPNSARRLEWTTRLGNISNWGLIVSRRWFNRLAAIKNFQWLLFKTYLPDDLLVKTDRASMLNSLETRVPLLDLKLIDYAFSTGRHFDALTLKKQLKTLAQSFLPADIINRKKKGFGIPLTAWSKDCLKPLIEKNLQREILKDYVADDLLKNSQENFRLTWALVILSAWLDSLFNS